MQADQTDYDAVSLDADSNRMEPADLAAARKQRRKVEVSQIKTRQRVRELAEVYTHKREVDAMLDLVPDMFPSEDDPSNTDRKFLEPACGSGNFLEEILRRKLKFVTTDRYGSGERYEHRLLRCLSSIYAIDIANDNVAESRERMRAVIASHLDNDRNREGFRANEIAARLGLSPDTIKTHSRHIYKLGVTSRRELLEPQDGDEG